MGHHWPGADWPGEWDMRWGVAPLPSKGGAATLGTASGYLISSQTNFPDACWQWVSFVSQQMPQDAVPARRSLAESSAYRDFVVRVQVASRPGEMRTGAKHEVGTHGSRRHDAERGFANVECPLDVIRQW